MYPSPTTQTVVLLGMGARRCAMGLFGIDVEDGFDAGNGREALPL